jgi:hypothetical protein
VAPVIALSTWTTRACSRSMLVSELSACNADTMPTRSMVPLVTDESRPGSTPPELIRHLHERSGYLNSCLHPIADKGD